MKTLNEVYSSHLNRRRYEVWFVRAGLANGAGAWWFRYLLLNPGRGGCSGAQVNQAVLENYGTDSRKLPVQVWATWFPRAGKPQTFIQGFSAAALDLSVRGKTPFHFRAGNNQLEEDCCRGDLDVDGHKISWQLLYRSSFRVTLSNKGWIGFSCTPHSDAIFSGRITMDSCSFEGEPLGFGVQGHNCGYRHRRYWKWAHAYFVREHAPASTLEALVYDMPFGLVFHKAVLWHQGKEYVFHKLHGAADDANGFSWSFSGSHKNGLELQAAFDGAGPSLHRLPYLKTDCSGSFEVANNSLASAVVCLKRAGAEIERLETLNGAVLEMTGRS